MKKDNTKKNNFLEEKITRKKAIKKAGITTLTAASMIFLSTKAYASGSGPAPGGWPT